MAVSAAFAAASRRPRRPDSCRTTGWWRRTVVVRRAAGARSRQAAARCNCRATAHLLRWTRPRNTGSFSEIAAVRASANAALTIALSGRIDRVRRSRSRAIVPWPPTARAPRPAAVRYALCGFPRCGATARLEDGRFSGALRAASNSCDRPFEFALAPEFLLEHVAQLDQQFHVERRVVQPVGWKRSARPVGRAVPLLQPVAEQALHERAKSAPVGIRLA